MIETERLLLRRFTEKDAESVYQLCNNYNLFKSTLNLPYPYTMEHATGWIAGQERNFAEEIMYEYAITDMQDGTLFGAIGLSNQKRFRHGELAYWIGEDYWGKGIGTEAAQAIITYAFTQKDYHKVFARFFKSNPASGRIMKKCGMEYEGTLKQHVFKEGKYEDLVLYGIINPNS